MIDARANVVMKLSRADISAQETQSCMLYDINLSLPIVLAGIHFRFFTDYVQSLNDFNGSRRY